MNRFEGGGYPMSEEEAVQMLRDAIESERTRVRRMNSLHPDIRGMVDGGSLTLQEAEALMEIRYSNQFHVSVRGGESMSHSLKRTSHHRDS